MVGGELLGFKSKGDPAPRRSGKVIIYLLLKAKVLIGDFRIRHCTNINKLGKSETPRLESRES